MDAPYHASVLRVFVSPLRNHQSIQPGYRRCYVQDTYTQIHHTYAHIKEQLVVMSNSGYVNEKVLVEEKYMYTHLWHLLLMPHPGKLMASILAVCIVSQSLFRRFGYVC